MMMKRMLIAVAVVALGVPATGGAALVGFRTPSGNIGCQGDTATSSIRCDIVARDWRPSAKPASCDFDWGNAVGLRRTGATRFLCVSDTVLGIGPKLSYGRSRRIGSITCTSRQRGLTCINRAGRGFELSRQRLRRF